jgi:hypothetical protein
MTVINKVYLLCDHARTGLGCVKHPIRMEPLERTLLHLCRDLKPALLLADQSELARQEAVRLKRQQAVRDELDQLAREVDSLAESIGRSDGARKRVLESKLDQKLERLAELEQDQSGDPRPNKIERIVHHLVSVEQLIKRMAALKGTPERNELRRRLKVELHQILDKIDIEAGQFESKLVMRYRNGFTLHLVVDRKGNPTLYYFDNGEVNVDPDYSEAVAAERAERQRKINAQVAKALRNQGLSVDTTW